MSQRRPFFSCDWGTSSFRLRLVSGQNREIEGELEEAHGVTSVRATSSASSSSTALGGDPVDGSPFAEYLLERLEYLAAGVGVSTEAVPVVISGMASSSIGWWELPYASVPFSLQGDNVIFQRFSLTGNSGRIYSIYMISGVATEVDMMRGEESELIGLKAHGELESLGERSIAILPGSHSKHVLLNRDSIEEWTTCFTGELFELLKTNSVLRFSVANSSSGLRERRLTPEEKADFRSGVEMVASRGLMTSLFQVRTRVLLKDASPTLNYWFLSGLVIGAEIRELKSHYGGHPWILLAGRKFIESYELAIEELVGNATDRIKVLSPEVVDSLVVRGHEQLLHRLG